jgi:uridine kinase
MSRAALVARLVEFISARRAAQPLRVAIDGPDAAGKSTLAAELAAVLAGAIVVSIDGFHRPSGVRRRRGSLSAEGYYEDAYDYDAVVESVLAPLGPGGSRRYRTAVFDLRTDAAVDRPELLAADGAVLLFEGVFLLRRRLRDHWDLSVFVDVSPDEALRRALVRDVDLFGDPDLIRERYRLRYQPAQRLYRADADPIAHADVVIDNDDPSRPRVKKWG